MRRMKKKLLHGGVTIEVEEQAYNIDFTPTNLHVLMLFIGPARRLTIRWLIWFTFTTVDVILFWF